MLDFPCATGFVGRWLSVALLLLLLLPLGVSADELRVPAPPLPHVVPAGGTSALERDFANPQSLADLQAIEERVVSLVEQLTECTVAIRVSGIYGSGVIISEDGYVLTAAHVIEKPGRRATILLADGTRARARTLGVNHAVDAGLLKLQSKDDRKWPHLKLGRSDELNPGDWCLALGHPGGFQTGRTPVVRLGRLLSARSRTIQTDCTLNSGDSGGPLLNLKGEVIGIHSRIAAPSSWNFHATVTTFHDDWDRFIAGEDWGRGLFAFDESPGPFLGIRGETDDKGCRVTHVEADSPAEKAGLKVDDVIVKFGGESIPSFSVLRREVKKHEAGQAIKVLVLREGNELTLQVELAKR